MKTDSSPLAGSTTLKTRSWWIFWLANGLLLAVIWSTQKQAADPGGRFPQKPIQVIVPFGASGGTDKYARAMKRAIDETELLPQPLVIRNRGGAGGTIGSRYAKNARPDGYTVLLLHDAILSAKYFGLVSYGPEAFEPIAATGESGMFIAVAVESPHQTLTDLLQAAAEKPETIVFGVNKGALTHLAALQLEAADNKARFLNAQTGGGAERYADLIGGHIDVSGFSAEEFVRFRLDETGKDRLRALAYLGTQRHPDAADIPTAIEQDREKFRNVVNSNTYYWWAPKNTPPERLAFLRTMLQSAVKTENVQQLADSMQIQPIFLASAELDRNLVEVEQRMAATPFPPQTTVFNSAPWIAAITGVLFLAVVVRGLWRMIKTHPVEEQPKSLDAATEPTRRGIAIALLLLTVGYVTLLAAVELDFRLATVLFVTLAGLLLASSRLQQLPRVLLAGQLLAVLVHTVMINWLDVDLP